MDNFENLHFEKSGDGARAIVWGHGWGQDHRAFANLIAKFPKGYTHYALDFPGFGASPAPETVMGTEDYAALAAALIREKSDKPVIWIGHSFGCRVGLQLAARHPELIAGLFLIAGAGLKRKRPLWQKLYFAARIRLFKLLKALAPLGLSQEWLYTKFGSRDYKAVSPTLRATFVRVVNEDLSDIAAKVNCPVMLAYGAQDSETPPEIGERFNAIIPDSSLVVLDNFDHYSILGAGSHQVAAQLNRFIKTVFKDA